jgi:hypothetical protein
LTRLPAHKFIKSFITCCFIFLLIFIAKTAAFTRNVLSQEITGKELFVQNRCANCHTIGRGKFVGPDLYRVIERYSREDIIKWMANPQQIYNAKGKMPLNEGYPPMPPMNVNPDHAVKIYEYLNGFELKANRPENGKIEGLVSNETTNTTEPDVEVKLTSYLGDISKENYTTSTDNTGKYSFDALQWDRAYVISLKFNGVEYATGKLVFEPEESAKTFDLPVYDTTNDDSLIMIDSSHIIIQIENDRASVAELSVINNGSNTVYIGKINDSEKVETLKFGIPDNAQSFQFHHGITEESAIVKDGYLTSNMSVQPGISRFVYSYEIPIDRNNIIDKKIDYMTNSQLILVSDNGYEVEVEGLGNSEQVDMNNQKFLKWTGNDLKRGQSIKISITKSLFTGDITKLILLSVIILIIIISAGYSFYYKKRGKPEMRQEFSEEIRIRLIKEIAKLDDMFEDGKIEKNDYKKLREEKKTRLIEITELLK